MSEFDIGSDDAMRVILSIRDMTDSSAKRLIDLLAKDPHLIEEMGMLIEDADSSIDEPQVNVPETAFRLPDNSEMGIQTRFLEALLNENEYLIDKHLRETPKEVLVGQLTVLANHKFPIPEFIIESVYNGTGSYSFLDKDGERIGNSKEDANPVLKLFENQWEEAFAAYSNPMQESDGIERRFERNDVDTIGDTNGRIDYSRGEGQYISGAMSSGITGVTDGLWGLSLQERHLVEIGFRDMGPRGRLEYLRNVFHTKPSERGKVSIRSLKKEGVTLLLLGNRVITFGWTRKLPRVPNWTRRPDVIRARRENAQTVNPSRRNSFEILSQNEELERLASE